MSERNEETEGVVQYDGGIFCLFCRQYFLVAQDDSPFAKHPVIQWRNCPNAGKTYQIPVLKEVELR